MPEKIHFKDEGLPNLEKKRKFFLRVAKETRAPLGAYLWCSTCHRVLFRGSEEENKCTDHKVVDIRVSSLILLARKYLAGFL